MISATLTISNPTGLHTRPGQYFVQKAKEYTSTITVKKEDKEANAKSLLKLLKLGINQGNTIEVICEGPDEQEALNALTEYVNTLTE